jgi:hypothetical protein
VEAPGLLQAGICLEKCTKNNSGWFLHPVMAMPIQAEINSTISIYICTQNCHISMNAVNLPHEKAHKKDH